MQIDVAAARPLLGVDEPVPLLRRRREALAGDLDRIRPDADLAAPGGADRAFRDDHVAVVETLREFEHGLVDERLRDRDLQVARMVAEAQEDELPEIAMLHDPPRDLRPRPRVGRGDTARLRSRGRLVVGTLRGLVEPGSRLGERHEPVGSASVGIEAVLAHPSRLLATRGDEFVLGT